MIDLSKLSKLFAILTFALILCIIAGEIKNTIFPIKIKNHNYPAHSTFNYGWMWIKETLQSAQKHGDARRAA